MNPASSVAMDERDLPETNGTAAPHSGTRIAEPAAAVSTPLAAAEAAAASRLAAHLESNAALVAYAQPVLDHLYRLIDSPTALLLLVDGKGMILLSRGDPLIARAAHVPLAPGRPWAEETVRRQPSLQCTVAPLQSPAAGLLVLLDAGEERALAGALLHSAAESIENRLVATCDGGVVLLRLHPLAEAIGTPLEGIAMFAEDGRLLTANRRARELLRIDLATGANPDFEACFRASYADTVRRARRLGHGIMRLRTADSLVVAGQVHLLRLTPGGSLGEPPSAPATPVPELYAGDPRVEHAFRRAAHALTRARPLLIEGELGTGKRFFAHMLHEAVGRRGSFVALPCAAVSARQMEEELFGALPPLDADGATDPAPAGGKLREAEGGTLFIDDVGEMPLALQPALVKLLETGRARSAGGAVEEAVDVVLVCASRRPLREALRQGRLLPDLYCHLSTHHVVLPPLRRRTDLTRVVSAVLEAESPGRPLSVAPDAMAFLGRHPWPGNLRQLRNALRVAAALVGEDSILGVDQLPADLTEEVSGATAVPGGRRRGQRRAPAA